MAAWPIYTSCSQHLLCYRSGLTALPECCDAAIHCNLPDLLLQVSLGVGFFYVSKYLVKHARPLGYRLEMNPIDLQTENVVSDKTGGGDDESIFGMGHNGQLCDCLSNNQLVN